eukprot:1968918-Prymnesium_polylepis.1
MDALGPRGECVSTVSRALIRVFRCPCPLLGGARVRAECKRVDFDVPGFHLSAGFPTHGR